MATFAQPVQIFPRPVYNYTLPEDFYRQSHSRSHLPRNYYPGAEHTVNPQQLMMSSPTSPPTDDYAFPTPQSPVPYGPRVVERSPSAYTAPKGRKRTVSASGYPNQYQLPSYASERSSAHQTSQGSMCFTSDLPTPPLSPSSTIPVSGTAARRSSAAPAPQSRRTSSAMSPYAADSPMASAPRDSHRLSVTATASSSSQRHYCMHPECTDPSTGRPARSFSRRADLQRHHACAHESQVLFSCPRPNCIRKGDNGFTRQDHLIEHRRGYHGENIPKRGSRSGARPKSPRR